MVAASAVSRWSDFGFTREGLRNGARGEYWVLVQLLLFVAFFVLPAWPRWQIDDIALWAFRMAGGLVLLLGLWLARSSVRALGNSLTPLPHPKDDAQLATGGPYRHVRHPIYSAVLTIALGYALLRTSASHAIAAMLLLLFFDLKARREERWLSRKFSGYAQYAGRTKRFIPRLY